MAEEEKTEQGAVERGDKTVPPFNSPAEKWTCVGLSGRHRGIRLPPRRRMQPNAVGSLPKRGA